MKEFIFKTIIVIIYGSIFYSLILKTISAFHLNKDQEAVVSLFSIILFSIQVWLINIHFSQKD